MPTTKYEITPEERERILREMAFYIVPITVDDGLENLSHNLDMPREKLLQVFQEEVKKGHISYWEADTEYKLQSHRYSMSEYYELERNLHLRLLCEIQAAPAPYKKRRKADCASAREVQAFLTRGVLMPLDPDNTSRAVLKMVSFFAFEPRLRPFLEHQSEKTLWRCFHLAYEYYRYTPDSPSWSDFEEAFKKEVNSSSKYAVAMKGAMYCGPYVYAGRFYEIPKEFMEAHHDLVPGVKGVKLAYEGKYASALKDFQSSLRLRNSKYFDDELYTLFYILTLARDKSTMSKTKLLALRTMREIRELPVHYPSKFLLSLVLDEKRTTKSWSYYRDMLEGKSTFERALMIIIGRHYKVAGFDEADEELKKLISRPDFKLLQLEASVDYEAFRPERERLQQELGFGPLLPPYSHQEVWEKVLDSLMERENASSTKAKPATSQGRVVYLVSREGNITPILQKSKDGIRWTDGRHIALKNFVKGIPEMTEQDREVAKTVIYSNYGWGSDMYSLGGPRSMAALAGHPLVFAETSPSTPVVITKEALQLTVTKTARGYLVQDNVGNGDYGYAQYVMVRETEFLFHIVELTDRQREMLPILHQVRTFPREASERLTALLSALSKTITIHSDLVSHDATAREVEADTHLTVQMQPLGEGIKAECFVKPVAGHPPYCKPGQGNVSVLATVDGEQVRAQRDLKGEQQQLHRLTEWLTDIAGVADTSLGDYYYYEDPRDCLTLLEVLQAHRDEVCVEWPQGERFTLAGNVDFSNLTLSGRGIGQWFELEGEVSIGEDQVITIGELLHRLRESHGRFVQLTEGQFVALSERLRSQLAALESVVQSDKEGDRVPSIAVDILSGFEAAGVKVKKDKELKALEKRIEAADRAEYPVPEGIRADLRDYQVTGYQWMARLSAWGAGACLADDMGLGKTLQTITLLLARAAEGASLVVTPTSVSLNWVSELQRFAPTLNPVVINDQKGERSQLIAEAKPFDVVLTTYGVLGNEVEALAAREWNVIVLDEAHTIKNKETKMSKAAMQLHGAARILLTGTPLQNNLGELWNLFQFANPGLLGDFNAFTAKFLSPIERQDDKERRRQLKQILRPFILRRTKTEVLDELPEKTEITLRVELSEPERALYESLRREAIENLAEGGQGNAIQALAEIMKLRQAACHPSLINPELTIPSSKTAAFCDLVDELMRNRHRALVFSQFTSHLALIRRALDERKVEYLYLDGSTPTRERNKLVKAFQEGSTPLFLISLKAGGLGLNLTAADYVIHMDPWWNPAIEDQASDRAYRMGQTRPVTVYRLIAAGTIEEKIIRLHQTKKSLADSLLEGSNKIEKISAAEILKLLREE